MTPELLVRRFYDELWNVPDPGLVPELLHPEVSFRGSLGAELRGHAAVAGYVAEVTSALRPYRCEIVELVADEGRAAARMRFAGRQVGPFLGRAPTGREVSWAGAAFFTVDGDRIRDVWVLGDLDGLRRQLDP
jgi:predicted ester cyclase